MRFEYPNFLFALFLIAIPIIIHLFNFKKYKTLYFSSLTFLKKVEQQTKSTKKLKHYLILASRVLFIIFLVFTFAKPFIPIGNSENINDKIFHFYLDNSYSMSSKGAEGELLSEAKEKTKELIASLNNDAKIILATNSLDGTELRLLNKADAIDKADQIKYSNSPRKISEVLNWMEQESDTKMTKNIVLMSDFQKSSSNLEQLKSNNQNKYHFIKLVPQKSHNLSIDSIWFENPTFKLNTQNTLFVKIKNHGSESIKNAEVNIQIEELKKDFFIDIDANQSNTLSYSFTTRKKGINEGTIHVNDKQISFDDDFYFSFETITHVNALIVNDKNFSPNIRQVYELDDYYKITEIESNNLNDEVLKNKDLVILNSINSVNGNAIDLLKNYSQNGGSIFIFFGNDIQKENINSLLLNLKLPTINTIKEDGNNIKSINYNHLFFKSVFDKYPTTLNSIGQNKIYASNSQKSTSIPLISLQNGNHLLVKSYDKAVYAFYSSLDNSFGEFTKNALFSTVLLRFGELTSKNQMHYLIFGKDNLYPISYKTNSREPVHLMYKNIDFIPQLIHENAQAYLNLARIPSINNLEAGNYEINQNGKIGNLSLNFSRDESNTEVFSDLEMKKIIQTKFKHVDYSSIENGQSNIDIKIKNNTQLWMWFLIGAIIFVLTEIFLIRFMK